MKRIATPWGESNESLTLAPGITRYWADRGGGIHLSLCRRFTVNKHLPQWSQKWFEEDREAAIVFLVFKTEFSDAHYDAAEQCARESAQRIGYDPRWKSVIEWLERREE